MLQFCDRRGRYETFRGWWGTPWCLWWGPTASHTLWPCIQIFGTWSTWSPSSCGDDVSSTGWLHHQSWCTASLAVQAHCPQRHRVLTLSRFLRRQGNRRMMFAVPCVAQWSVCAGLHSLRLQGLDPHTRWDWVGLRTPRPDPWWQSDTFSEVLR